MLKIWLPLNKDERNIGLAPGFCVNSGVTYDGIGPNGQICANFTGTNQYVRIPIDGLTGMTDYCSVCFWAKLSSFNTAWQTIFAFLKAGTPWTGNVFTFIRNNNTSAFTFSITNGSSSTQASLLTGNLSLDTWYHFACVYEPGLMSLYQNGELLRTYSTTIKPCFSAMTHAALGVECNTAFTSISYQHRGFISDFRVYDHRLRDWEIKKLYNSCFYEMESNIHLEPSTNINIAANKLLTTTAYNGANGKYGYNATSNLRKETVVIDNVLCDKVTMITGNTAVYPYVFFQPIHPSSGNYKTVSFDYFPTTRNSLIPYTYGGNANIKWISNYSTSGYGQNVASATIPVNVNQWNHVDVTLQGTTSATTGWGYFRIGTAKFTGTTSDYWLFKNVQVTELDHPIEYTYFDRDERFVDMSGFDNEVVPYNITQSGTSLYFNGTNSAIKVPIAKIITGGTWSLNVWFYRPNGQFGTKAWETLIGGPSGFELESTSSSTKTAYICPYSWGGGKFAYEMDKWNMVTLTRTSSGSKLYLNGELIKSGSAGSVPNGDYFIGAWKTSTQQNFKGYMKRFSIYTKVLSDDDVMNLYLHNE